MCSSKEGQPSACTRPESCKAELLPPPAGCPHAHTETWVHNNKIKRNHFSAGVVVILLALAHLHRAHSDG